MSGFNHGALSIDAASDPASSILQLIWRGRSVERQPGEKLGPFLKGAIGTAAAQHACLELRFENLEYFNSATVTSIIQCLHTARSQRVRVRLVYDDALEWQRLTFDPLHVFAVDESVELCPLHESESPERSEP